MAVKKPAPDPDAEVASATDVRRPSPAESVDPAVHQLLAHRQAAQMNDDAAAVAAVDEQLAALGY